MTLRRGIQATQVTDIMSIVDDVPRPTSHWQAMCVCALSIGFGVGATQLLASLADARGWCCVHSWAMLHGSGEVVLLLFGLLGFHLVRGVGKRLGLIHPLARSSWLPHVAYISGALGTFVFTAPFMWVGLFAGGAAVLQRMRGRAVRPFGLAIIGVVVSLWYAWLYIRLWWMLRSIG
jgi:hypothetical protein